MTVLTVLPAGVTRGHWGWTVTGAASTSAALSDGSDSSYIAAPASGATGTAVVFGAASIPAYARIDSVTIRLRVSGGAGGLLTARAGWQQAGRAVDVTDLTVNQAVTSSTLATISLPPMSAAPGGRRWNAQLILPALQLILEGRSPVRVYEAYLDVSYTAAPDTGTLALTVSGSQRPTIMWQYASAGYIPQERAQVRVFPQPVAAAPTFSPSDLTGAAWSTELLSSATQVDVGTALPAGPYSAFLRVADAGSQGRFGPWSSQAFTVGVGPAIPTGTVAVA